MDTGGQEGSGAPGASQGARPSNKRLQQTQAQVDEVVGIMKVSSCRPRFNDLLWPLHSMK